MALMDRLPAKFRDRFKVTPQGCWEWTGRKSRDGYGRFYVGKRQYVYAHRFAYENLVGPVPEGIPTLVVKLHSPCVNPDHLEPVTHRENCRRGLVGEVSGAKLRAITHCPQGHAYTSENTYIYKGSRRCRACHREKERLRRANRLYQLRRRLPNASSKA